MPRWMTRRDERGAATRHVEGDQGPGGGNGIRIGSQSGKSRPCYLAGASVAAVNKIKTGLPFQRPNASLRRAALERSRGRSRGAWMGMGMERISNTRSWWTELAMCRAREPAAPLTRAEPRQGSLKMRLASPSSAGPWRVVLSTEQVKQRPWTFPLKPSPTRARVRLRDRSARALASLCPLSLLGCWVTSSRLRTGI